MSTLPSSLAVPLPMPAPERLRRRQVVTHANARQLFMDGQQYVQFSSNDYLGLAQHPKVIQAFQQGVNDYGCSSASSPLITGYQAPHVALETRLKEWLGRDDVLLFGSGFAANSGILKLLAEIYPKIYLDKLSHASLLDGVKASRVWQRFKHQDFADLQRLLSKDQGQLSAQLVVTEGVFSMDGDQTDAKALSQLLKDTRVATDLFVDDAHAIGVLGPSGEGIGGLLPQSQVPLLTATFGKALGGAGAFFAGPADVVDYLVQYCREYMYS
ncbi:8-amino-7-oxononanoate synthase, partial [Thalassospira xiamenensis]